MKANPWICRLGLFCLLGYGPAVAWPADAPAPSLASANSRALSQLLDEQWQYQLKDTPELATTIGDDRYNDRWTDFSLAHVAVERAATENFLKRFQALDLAGLSEQELLSQKMMVRQLQDNLEAIRLKNYEMPLDQIEGQQLQFPEFVSSIPFNTTKDYEDYLQRLLAIPKELDDITAASRQGLKDGLIQPRYLLEKVAVQCGQIAAPAGEANAFGQPVMHFPAGVPVADQQRLRKAILAAVDEKVRPAYRRLAEFVAKDYAPHGRSQEGLWALPDGDERYRFAIHQQTTTDLSPAQIHQIGLNEVARIEGEMLKIAHELGYADLASLRAAVAKNPKLYATSREQIVDQYRAYIAGMQPQLPKLFGHLPHTALEVRPVEPFREKDAAGAEYHQGTPDGSRPGIVFVNTSDYAQRTLYAIEDTAYHEGVPGHHLQISIAQTLPLPPFRQQAAYNAFVEGWALYAEQLAKEIGFYKDPYNDYGHLDEELLRADRLVLDTGVHYLHWNRQQMIDFFHAHPADDEPDMQAETDRYIAWPAQALGYKLGELKFLQLRARAKKELGAKFDIRAFHDEMLSGGAMPLDMLDARTNAWIAASIAAKH
ncbi:DUF885 domain-containing protein [Dyella mobilis]|uniref:DUF885 family protein n=1 Tax=Dyella mobilis TaxID=1849582 RepID=A0ABS2KJ76_9GAMM|nr:DUF885 family protein [Dyella mobilis]MBM7131129.1 DUF885 family protein [Dyella mobilis]GLQ98937.1 hypothetical protein GCM10007863_33570 [Dyella mobilis]